MQSLVVLVVLALFVTLGSASPYAGVTKATYNGSMTHYPDTNGYDDAKVACLTEFADTHVCTTHELALIAQSDSLRVISGANVRYLDLTFSVNADQTVSNDCDGFTSASAKYSSKCLRFNLGAPLLPAVCTCDTRLSWICCSDSA